jgi:hypothetical protein
VEGGGGDGFAGNGVTGSLAHSLGIPGMNEQTIKNMLAGYGGPLLSRGEKRAFIQGSLQSAGIAMSRRDLNLFQRARAHLASFGRWRKKQLVP